MSCVARGFTFVHASNATGPVLRRPDGSTVTIPDNGGVLTVGSAKNASIQVMHEKILPEHCAIRLKSGRLFCRCTIDQTDDDALGLNIGIPSDTHVYLEGSQLRGGVDYMVPPNAKICFGENDSIEYVIAEFEEVSGSGQEAMSEMLMKGMVSGGSKDVQDALKDKFQ